jgi:hypothetical protein
MTFSGTWVMSIYGMVPVGSGCDAYCILLPTGAKGMKKEDKVAKLQQAARLGAPRGVLAM